MLTGNSGISKTKKVLPSGTLSETRESGLRVYRRGISIVKTCCQLRSSKLDVICKLDRRRSTELTLPVRSRGRSGPPLIKNMSSCEKSRKSSSSAAETRAAGLTARRCDVGRTLRVGRRRAQHNLYS